MVNNFGQIFVHQFENFIVGNVDDHIDQHSLTGGRPVVRHFQIVDGSFKPCNRNEKSVHELFGRDDKSETIDKL